jgi:hypothetical protein
MQGGKNWISPKDINADRFFRGSHWLEIWTNHFCPCMGPNGRSVAMDFRYRGPTELVQHLAYRANSNRREGAGRAASHITEMV